MFASALNNFFCFPPVQYSKPLVLCQSSKRRGKSNWIENLFYLYRHYNKISVSIFCHFNDPVLLPTHKIPVTFHFRDLCRIVDFVHTSVVTVQPSHKSVCEVDKNWIIFGPNRQDYTMRSVIMCTVHQISWLSSFIHNQLYNSQRVLACIRNSLHSSWFMAVAHQILVPNILASFRTSSFHVVYHLPTFLIPSGFMYISLLGIQIHPFLLHDQPTAA